VFSFFFETPFRLYSFPVVQPIPEFDRYAAQYSTLLADPLRDWFADKRFFHQRKLWLIREFFRQRGLPTGNSSWVDIGCGQGDLLKLGMAHFGSAAGCDVSPGMMAGCQGLSIRAQVQDEILPFPDRSVDFATAVCVYHHVRSAKRAGLTREAARILKPGGIFCIIEHNPANPVTRAVVKRCPVDADAKLLSVSEARRMLEEQNFHDLSVRHFLFFPEWLFGSLGFLERWLTWLPAGGQYAVFGRTA
jgi:SAM-dependent methyltransferase